MTTKPTKILRKKPTTLLTVGEIAAELKVPVHRIEHAIKRRGIEPAARSSGIGASGARVFDRVAMAGIRHAINAADAKQAATKQPNSSIQLMTIGQVATYVNAPIHRVEYVIKSRGIAAMAWSGHARVFDREAVAVIRQALSAIEARRSCRPGDQDESAPTLFDVAD